MGNTIGWLPPRGSLEVPHPRTIGDILFRSAVINVFAYIAYYHFIQILSRQRSSCHYSPALRYTLPLLAVLLPELVPIQLFSWFVQDYSRKSWKLQTSRRQDWSEGSRPQEHSGAKHSRWAIRHVALAMLNLIPLWAAIRGYRERLAMRYHEATYVGNLTIDHRNGWAAFAGLIAATTTILVIVYLLMTGRLETVHRHDSSNNKLLEKMENGGYDSSEDSQSERRGRSRSRSGDKRGRFSRDNSSPAMSRAFPSFVARLFSLLLSFLSFDSMVQFEILVAIQIHQILLRVTNRVPPLLLLFSNRTTLLKFIAFFILIWTFKIGVTATFLGRKHVKISKSHILHDFIIYGLTAFVLITVCKQAVSDAEELYEVAHGKVREWNYRWQVKDYFSEGDSDRVYMG